MQTQTVQQRATHTYTLNNLPNPDDFYDKIYRLMPNTRIITLCNKYKVVFVVDVTCSLATVDYYTGDVVISEVFERYVQ